MMDEGIPHIRETFPMAAEILNQEKVVLSANADNHDKENNHEKAANSAEEANSEKELSNWKAEPILVVSSE
jgi:hypothetical protein